MIIFHHIPKTAGSTFHDILCRQYASEKIFSINGLDPAESWKQFNDLTQEEIDDLALIKGHLANYFEDKIRVSFKKIVFVREPIDLFLSSYYYIRRAKHNRYHDVVVDMTLDEFIDFRVRSDYHNPQSCHLCGYTDINNNGEIKEVDQTILLEICRKQMVQIEYLFTTDWFDASLMYLSEQLKWKKAPYYITRNKTTSRPGVSTLTECQLERIRNLTQVDEVLYKYAEQHSENCLDGSIREKTRKSKIKNKIFSYGSRGVEKILNAL